MRSSATSQNYGQRLERGAFDWAQCKVHRDREVAHLSALYRDMLLKQGVVLKPGKGRVTGPHTVEVCGELIECRAHLSGHWLRAIPDKFPRPSMGHYLQPNFLLGVFAP